MNFYCHSFVSLIILWSFWTFYYCSQWTNLCNAFIDFLWVCACMPACVCVWSIFIWHCCLNFFLYLFCTYMPVSQLIYGWCSINIPTDFMFVFISVLAYMWGKFGVFCLLGSNLLDIITNNQQICCNIFVFPKHRIHRTRKYDCFPMWTDIYLSSSPIIAQNPLVFIPCF